MKLPAFIFFVAAILMADAAQAQVVTLEPPGPRVEVIPAPPGPAFVWTPGHWWWDGHRWHWARGHYRRAPRPGAVWIPGGWRPGPGLGWHWVPGHWAYR
ncbi:MAG: hypothetical protein ACHQRJ_08610 [Alphaproteobacteria bacterium]